MTDHQEERKQECKPMDTQRKPTALPKEVETQAYVNPSYDMNLTPFQRLVDFLGAYHITRNGVVPHKPFAKYPEDGGGMCCDESKTDVLEFVEALLTQAHQDAEQAVIAERERVLKAVRREVDNNTFISEIYGWRSILEQSIENVREQLPPSEQKE